MKNALENHEVISLGWLYGPICKIIYFHQHLAIIYMPVM